MPQTPPVPPESTVIITDEEPAIPPVQEPTRLATLHETITHAHRTAATLMGLIQQANSAADPMTSVLLLPLVADTARIVKALAYIEHAMEVRP